MFNEPFVWKETPTPWGLVVPESYREKLHKHIYMVRKLVDEPIDYFCDISAGSVRFSWEIATRAKLSFLCDISVDSVVYISKKVAEQRIKNICAVRCDYLNPPFKESIFDVVLCNDTLIYGYYHEMKLLSSIYSLLRTKGYGIVDFSNKYHRGFWHKPYTVAYSKKNMVKMLKEAKFQIREVLPLYYELTRDLEENTLSSKLTKLILPPSRYIFKVVK